MAGVDPCMIGDIELFRGLSAAQLSQVSGHLYCRTYPAGANIITVEQPGEVVYLIQNGTLKIHIEQANGSDVILAILGRGDIVGEMSLVDSAGRSASVITLEESKLFWMAGKDFQECLRAYPLIAQNLVRILSRRVRLANELVQALANLDVHGRAEHRVALR